MNEAVKETTLQEMAQYLLAGWQRAHGVMAGQAYATLFGRDNLTIYLEDVLCQAEKAVAQRSQGEDLMERYVKELMQQVCVEATLEVEKRMERRVAAANVQVECASGNIICIFHLAATGQ